MIRRPYYRSPLLILLLIFLLQWLLLLSIKEPTWDAVSYYVYARSAVFDGDLQFENDYQLSYPTAGEHFASKNLDQVKTITGRVENLFASGTALIWLPWLSLLRLIAPLLLPSDTLFNGYERFFVSNLATLSALLGFLAVLLSYRVASKVANGRLALFSAATLMFTTPLLFYQFREPMYSHSASALAVSLAVFLWWKQHNRIGTTWQALGLGAAIGLAALVRWQNVAYILLPFISALMIGLKSPQKHARQVWDPAFRYLLFVGFATLAVFSLQMAVWKVLYGSFVIIPQGNTFIGWRPLYLAPFLFSSFRGLLPWMPVFFLCLTGLIALSKRNPQAGLPLMIMLLLAVYINGSTRDWFAGGGFGPRRLTSEFVLLVVGYAAFLKLLPRRIRSWAALLLGAVLLLHQWILLRFGLPERLGGRVMSMAPTFDWEDIPLAQFISDFSALTLRAGRQPLNFLIFPGSPLDQLLRQGTWPIQHAATLLATALFTLLIVGAVVFWSKRMHGRIHQILLLILTILVLVAIDFWILVLA